MELRVLATAEEMGSAAAREIAKTLRKLLAEKGRVRVMFAAAPSQSAMLHALLHEDKIAWDRVDAFHMDEYFGLTVDAPQRFGNWLRQEFFDRVPMGSVHLMQPGDDREGSCSAYASLLEDAPVHVVLLGIGTNGHLAFNDPPADLQDVRRVKVVTLDEMCRAQQVFDGCFGGLDEVPLQAMTVTVPELLRADYIFGCVPGAHKRDAVRCMLEAPISGQCPATALRDHPQCLMFVDRTSYPERPPS